MSGSRIFDNVTAAVDLLADHGALPIALLAERLDLPCANALRITAGLIDAGMAVSGDDGRVQLSTRWLHLAEASRRAKREWASAHEALTALAATTGQTACLIVPEGDHGLCIDWAPGRGIGVLELRPGGTLPLHAGAGGLVILAFGNRDTEKYLRRAPFAPLTPGTITEADALRAEVESIRQQGFTVSDEDVTIGVYSVGVPVEREGGFAGALSLGGLKATMLDRRDEFVETLREAALSLT